ncbi:hypothetical protein EI94DRAFT_1730846 [Lactarius quietus]|nr:hypothetical protein EI94DRAFT_1730846 [Lactarius quietus]
MLRRCRRDHLSIIPYPESSAESGRAHLLELDDRDNTPHTLPHTLHAKLYPEHA